MLARIRVGDRRFIAAASGPPRGSQPCCAWTAGLLRDLDLTAAYGIEAATRATAATESSTSGT